MKEIALTQGYIAIVDDQDFEIVSQYKWRVKKATNLNYAQAHSQCGDGKSKSIFMHRFVLNPAPGQEVDHIDHNGLNCTRANMRLCSKSQNMANQRKQRGKDSIYKGVSWDSVRNKWLAQIKINGKAINLGRYVNELDDYTAYSEAAKKLFGEFYYAP